MSQALPSSDAFAYGSPAYGTNVIGYLGARLATGSFQAGRVHDGYGGASPRSDDQADATGNPVGFMRRQAFVADVKVACTARKVAVTGVPLNSHLKQHAVLARLTAGTLAGDGTSSVRLQDCTCYAFTMEWLAGGPAVRYRLKRFVAGVETVLATYDDPTAVPAIFFGDIRLTLVVVTNGGGDVELQGFVANAALGISAGGSGTPGGGSVVWSPGGHGGASVSTPGSPVAGTHLPVLPGPAGAPPSTYGQPTDTLVVSVVDSSGSKITAAGRCGFALDPERVHSSPSATTVSVASVFEAWDAADIDVPVLLLRDEFQRLVPGLGEGMSDRFGTAGRNVASDYTCDQASVATAGKFLKRNTSSEAAESPATVPLGKAVTLDGTLDYLELQNSHKSYPLPPIAAESRVSLATWAKLSSSGAATRTLYAGHSDPLAFSGQGFRFQLVVAGASSKLQLYIHSSQGTNTFDSPTFDVAQLVNQAWCYAFSFKANANTGTGEGRIRFYIGRLGVATLIGEVAVPADEQPQWKSFGTHTYGASQTPDNRFAGTVDELHVFFDELTPEEVAQVCNASSDPALFVPMGLVAGWHLDTFTDLGGADGKRWGPYFSAAPGGVSADTADWLREKNTVTVADPGLIPVSPAAAFLAFAQRAADDAVDQHRELSFRPASDVSIGGIVLRAAPTATPGVFTGYRLDVAPGTPARVVLYRVLAGVQTAMAEQDPIGGTVNVASAAFALLALQVSQQPLGGAGGPVLLTPKIGGVLVPMVSLQAGQVLVDLSGNVVDVSGARILSGPGEGFHGFVDGLANRFDDWQLAAGSEDDDPSTFDSYPVPDEDEGVFGDLADVLTPQWELIVEQAAPALVTRYESGHTQRRVLEDYVHRGFQLQLRGGSDAEILALRDFWAEHKGGVLPFTFDPSAYLDGQQAGSFRFRDDSLTDGWEGNRRVTRFALDEARAS